MKSSLPTYLVCVLLLLLAGGMETIERHDHGSLESGHNCPACRLADAPADLPSPDDGDAGTRPPDPGAVLPQIERRAPEAPLAPILHLRGPPLS
jgi:hypothetical protein